MAINRCTKSQNAVGDLIGAMSVSEERPDEMHSARVCPEDDLWTRLSSFAAMYLEVCANREPMCENRHPKRQQALQSNRARCVIPTPPRAPDYTKEE